MKNKTFKPGDYCRFTPEEIPSIIALLKANGHKMWDYNASSPDVIICDESGDIYASYLNIAMMSEEPNELSKHDFLVTALRLNEGDRKMTREEFAHIESVLDKLGVENAVIYLGTYNYSEWCKRLNVEPIHLPDVGETITLPDGTTVDLSKPLEYSDDGQTWKFDNAYDYIGISKSGQYVFEYCGLEFYKHKHIRNKPDPEFKPVDKLKDLDEDLKAFIVSNLPELDWVGSDSCASAFLSVDEDGVIEDSLMLSLSKAVIACSDKPFSLSIRPVESEVLLYYID